MAATTTYPPTLNGFHNGSKVEGNSDASHDSFEIAVIGGGIIGLMTALGLQRRGMRVTIYERANDYPEVGVGMAFTGVARDCMQRLDPRVLEALQRVGEENRHPMNRYWDGFNPTSKEAAQSHDALLFQMSARELSYWGCLRYHFLREMAAELPEGTTQFGKQLTSYVDDDHSDKVILRFADGSEAEADAVIGCDGIHSRTRKLVLGEASPASSPGFSHQVAYRAVVPIAEGVAALGKDKANNQCIHMGPNAMIVSYPVNKWTLFNIAIFLYDPKPWPDSDKLTTPATRDEVAPALRDWSPAIRDLVQRLPENLTKWAIFDTADNPASTYARGRVCLAGDAAHASSPFHGAGACMGVEDAMVLANALGAALAKVRGGLAASRGTAIEAALRTFSDVCIERSQWLVRSSREIGDISEWRYPVTGKDVQKCKAEFETRSRKIWDFDISKLVNKAEGEFERQLKIMKGQ